MSSAIKTVVLAGATGNLGPAILAKLQAAGNFKVKVFRRKGSSSTVPEGSEIVDVDYNSVSDLTSALQGVDAVVSAVAAPGLGLQNNLIDASIAAGVKRFIPSEFGSNLDNQETRQLAVFADKVKTQEYIKEKAKSTDLTYTFVYNGAFLDWGLLQNFIVHFNSPNPLIVDDGNTIFSLTDLSAVGDAVVGILTHPEETKNRVVYIDSIKLSQNKILDLARQQKPEKTWEPKYISIGDLAAASDARVAEGNFDRETITQLLYRALMNPNGGSKFEKTDNELLGLKPASEEDVVRYLKQVL